MDFLFFWQNLLVLKFLFLAFIFEPHHEKTYLRGLRLGRTSNQPAPLQKLASLEISYIATIGIILSKEEQQRCFSDCADAQTDLHLCCSHMA